MPYRVERLEGKRPILIVTWLDPADPVEDGLLSAKEIDRLVGKDEAFWNVQDMTNLKINFGMIVKGMSQGNTDIPGAPGDPRCRSTVALIGSGMLWELVAKGTPKMRSGGFGLPIFTSREEALEHIRQIDGK